MFHTVERIFLRMLLGWALLSMVLGGIGLLAHAVGSGTSRGEAFLGALALQFLAWGAINAALAGWALRQLARRERAPLPAERQLAERERSIRVLRLNAGLDLLWLAIGVALLLLPALLPDHAATLVGHGVGVVLQGGFLLLFDRLFARRLQPLLHVKD